MAEAAMTRRPNPNNPGLTYPEASALIGVIGDVDPAHFEYRAAAYYAASQSGTKKLLSLAKGSVMVPLSKFEIRQLLEAVSQMTWGNSRSFDEWRRQTHGTKAQWDALIAAEARLTAAL